jgi:hypothetical protein
MVIFSTVVSKIIAILLIKANLFEREKNITVNMRKREVDYIDQLLQQQRSIFVDEN